MLIWTCGSYNCVLGLCQAVVCIQRPATMQVSHAETDEDVSTLHLSELPEVWSMRLLKLLCEPCQVNQADGQACAASILLARCRPAVYVKAEGFAIQGRACCLLSAC